MEDFVAGENVGGSKNLVEIKIESLKIPSPSSMPTSQGVYAVREAALERPSRFLTTTNKQQSAQPSSPSVQIMVTTSNNPTTTMSSPVAALSGTHHLHSVHHLPLSATTSLSNASGNVMGDRSANPSSGLDRTGGAKSVSVASRSAEPSCKPTPTKRNANKINTKGRKPRVLSVLDRRCPHHSFLTEVTDVQQMEQGLVQLLDDFHIGKLQAFGKDCSFEKMDNVRERQERLARLHFDLGSQQETYGTLSEEGRSIAKDHLAKLMMQLQELSLAIEQLQSSTSGTNLQTEV